MNKAIRTFLFVTATIFGLASFAQKKQIDLLIVNAKVYTVDANFSVAGAIAIHKGKVVETGASKHLSAKYHAAERVNARGKFIYPGFIDAHAHFLGYGLSLQIADLTGTKSWDDILEKLREFSKKKNLQPGEWITGRGWDQNDWEVKQFPTKQKLDELFPNNPVLITRVDGHAAVANQKALELANVRAGQTLTGGDIEVKKARPDDPAGRGELTGILIDNAIGLVASKIPAPTVEQLSTALYEAQQNCFAVGLTTVDDCGLGYQSVLLMDSLQKAGLLKMRIYAMLSDAAANFEFAWKHGKIKTDLLNVRSFKVYADGALGSRGAALLLPYSDRPEWYGFLLSSQKHFDSVANIIAQHDFQMCTHAIGDSGNRTILNIYGKYLKRKNDRRWRIEHAQVVNEKDFNLFGRYSVIPSVQPTHATSDMYWAKDRLGPQRVKGAYAYRQLMNENGWIPLGTDFPVEDISTFKTFCSAVFRKDANNFPASGFQTENALTRQQALRGMTIWAAKSNFEEKEKGSIEKGKFADLVVLDVDLMKASQQQILKAKVAATYINGKKVYESH